jgi:hypothetical protein
MALSSCLGSSHSFLCYLWVRKHLDSIFELQQKWNEKIGSYFSFALVQLVGRGSFKLPTVFFVVHFIQIEKLQITLWYMEPNQIGQQFVLIWRGLFHPANLSQHLKKRINPLFGCVEPKTGIVLTCENEKGNTKTFVSMR